MIPADLPDERRLGGADFVPDEDLSTEDFDGMGAVLTGCGAAVAVSGTIMLDAVAAQGRRAITPVPDHHVVVVRRDQVVGHLAEALPMLDPTAPRPGSPARPRPATSNPNGWKGSTAPAASTR